MASMTSPAKSFRSRIQQDDIYSIPIDDFFKSAFSVDCVIFGYHDKQLKVLLIERGTEPYGGYWAFLGDFVHPCVDLDLAPSRVLPVLTALSYVTPAHIHTIC